VTKNLTAADDHARYPRNEERFADHSFPPDGLVAKSRIAYLTTPLSRIRVRTGVFVFSGAGGNVVAIEGSRGCVVVDTGYGPRVAEIKNTIEAVLAQEARWLINTHWHFDHTDGNAAFAHQGATILAHINCRARLSKNQFVPSLDWRIAASPRNALPAITFDQPLVVDIGSETLQLLPQAPAHTDGDVAVALQATNVLVMGDLFTHGSYPVIDESSGGSLRGMIAAINGLLPLVDGDTVVVPGHGPATDLSGLLAFRDMLCKVEDRIGSMILAGLSFPEILTSNPTEEFDPVWGRGYVTGPLFTGMVLAGWRSTAKSTTSAP